MKCATIALALLLAGLTACGGNNSTTTSNTTTSTTSTTTKITTRAYVSNAYSGAGVTAGTLEIVDYKNDTDTQNRIGCCGSASRMLLSPNRSLTLVLDRTQFIQVVTNSTNSRTTGMTLSAWTESFLMAPDNKTVYAAVRNSSLNNPAVPGNIEYADVTASTITVNAIPVPLVRHIFMSHDGKRMVAFSDDSNSATIIDVSSNSVIATVPGFDEPVAALFSNDDTKAYVLNCGPECGGTTAGVSVIDMATATASPITATSGATAGFSDGNTLYVAGTGTAGPMLTTFTITGNTLSANGNPIQIGDGMHAVMSMGSNNKLFIGANNCTAGCLSIVDVGTRTAVIAPKNGDVTGMDPVPNRARMYVVEGGELHIYDTTTSAIANGPIIDIVGQAYDVKMIDNR